MIDTQTTGAGGGSGGNDSGKTAARALAPSPLDAPTPKVRLAHHPTLKVAVAGTDKTEPAFRRPATVSGVANVYGLPPIYFPDEEAQRRGFTPYFVARRADKPTAARYDEEKRHDGLPEGEVRPPLNLFPVELAPLEEGGTAETVEIDFDSAAEAVRVVLTQFAGVYKSVEEKKGA